MAETGYKPVPHDAAFRKTLLAKPGVKKAFDALEEEYTALHAMPSTVPAPTAPATPLPGPLTLQPVNANVHSVHLTDGAHVGNLKRVGTVWKFKAVGYDATGAVEPGGGPLTEQHNMVFAQPDAAEVSARLLAGHAALQPQ